MTMDEINCALFLILHHYIFGMVVDEIICAEGVAETGAVSAGTSRGPWLSLPFEGIAGGAQRGREMGYRNIRPTPTGAMRAH
jgi:hypothetical protein